MRVTLDIFSGRPNPTWTLTEEQQRQLFDRIQGRRLAPADSEDAALGYQGLIVRPSEDDSTAFPQEFRVGGGAAPIIEGRTTGDRPLSADEDNEVVQFLLNAGRATLTDELQELIASERQRLSPALPLPPIPPEPLPVPEPTPAPPPSPCQILNTPFNPGFWNVPSVQYYNNCYNYAMNDRTDTYAQPGRISGDMYDVLTCADVGAAASRDGCKPSCDGRVKLVALVMWPGQDYHWYRRQKEGFWGHKRGGTKAKNTDEQGRLIDGFNLTPANCNRGPYTQFCGYRYSPKGMKVL